MRKILSVLWQLWTSRLKYPQGILFNGIFKYLSYKLDNANIVYTIDSAVSTLQCTFCRNSLYMDNYGHIVLLFNNAKIVIKSAITFIFICALIYINIVKTLY